MGYIVGLYYFMMNVRQFHKFWSFFFDQLDNNLGINGVENYVKDSDNHKSLDLHAH